MTGAVPQTPDARGQAPPQQAAQQPSLDTPQRFEAATSYQVRDTLQDYLERDLLGPWDGEDEVLPPRGKMNGKA